MAYREENGQVVLTITLDDWQNLMLALGIAAGASDPEHPMLARIFNLVHRLNDGNPNYRPYQVAEKS